MTPEQIKVKIQEARNQGVPDEVTFKYLNDKGLIPKDKFVTTSPIQREQEPGFIQSLAQTLASPVLKLASTGRAIIDTARAQGTGAELQNNIDEINKKEYDYGYLGKVASIQNPIQAAGVGAELGSYAIPGGAASGVIKTGLKGQVIRGAFQGAATGAASGATMSFGQALQEAEVKPSDVAIKTLFGGVLGGATGGVLGGITPVVVKGVNATKRFTNLDQINTELQNLNNQVLKPGPKQMEKWSVQGKDPIKTYTEIFGTDVPAVGKDNRFTRESISDAVQRVDDIYKPASEGFNTILRNSPEVNSISKARDMAVKNLDAYNLTPESYTRAVAKIDGEFNAIKTEAQKKGLLLGDDSIPVHYSDNLKDRFWGATKNFGTEDATIANSVNSSIGHGFKDSIENSIQDINVKNYNKQLGDLIVLRDFLETKSGALAGTGGKMTRLMARVAGTVAGSSGGPIGAVMGNITGDKLAQILINPAYQPYRWLINKKLQQLPQADVLRLSQEANQVIEAMLAKRMSRLALPEGSKLGTANNPIITPPPKDPSGVRLVPAEVLPIEKLTRYDTPEIIKLRALQKTEKPTIEINTPERFILRKKIADQLYGKGAINKNNRLDIVMGPPAAGKSTLSNPLAKKHGSLIIDADSAKEMLPEYKGGKGAGVTHTESSTIVEGEVLTRAIMNRDNIVFPTVGKNLKKLEEYIQAFRDAGYSIHITLNHLDADLATQRAIKRFEETGRFVDPDYVLNEVGNKPLDNAIILKNNKNIKSFRAFDNDVEEGQSPRKFDM